MKKIFPLALLLTLTTPINADEGNHTQICAEQQHQMIAHHFKIAQEQLSARALASACKTAPNNSAETLVSYAVIEPKYSKENYQDDHENTPKWTLFVARVNENSILQSWAKEMEIDAALNVNADSLKIDTVRYILNDKVRAFGVRFNNAARGPSAPEYSANDHLMLFVPEKEKLKLVFDYPMAFWSILDDKETKTETTNLVLQMDNKQTNGFNDIIVKADITQHIWSTGFYDIGRELKSENYRQEKVRLKYNGSRYSPVEKAEWLH
ncbi:MULTISPECIES: hypothetical protein [unclassified Mannheimia]|uniref:hypothetical protein n=1 Tax=unclassified Mannheimia TaxID=2645054 RepID=UPI00359E3EF2